MLEYRFNVLLDKGTPNAHWVTVLVTSDGTESPDELEGIARKKAQDDWGHVSGTGGEEDEDYKGKDVLQVGGVFEV